MAIFLMPDLCSYQCRLRVEDTERNKQRKAAKKEANDTEKRAHDLEVLRQIEDAKNKSQGPQIP